MAVIKCKMCGGDLNLVEGASTAECEYCGSVQTIPKVDDEKKLTLFARAHRLRAACDFDKAAGVYEAIVADFPEEAEAYWGLVLCTYGIEYVDDPATGKKVPTCHRSGFDSVMKDQNVELAQEYADVMARKLYREEAKAIEELRKGIIAVSANEEPYDLFICYKETDFEGKRTLDSVLAQDIYDALTEKGYRVFFSRITLEDKLGVEYEPYIFAALNSAKIMLVVGTDYEYFNAVWVKNEWSRFLKLMAKDKSKHLIPCYKGIDAYDMPEEFARLQAQDLDKMGAVQDIVRGVQKLLPKQEQIVKETVVVQQAAAGNNPTIESYLKRVFMFLQDGEWESADEYCEKVLDIDPECAEAYLGKLMAEFEVETREELEDCDEFFDGSNNYEKAIRFGDEKLKSELNGYIAHIDARKEEEHIAREKREEEERAAREKREEEERAAREKCEEEERVAREKREEEERIARECRKNELSLIREKIQPAQHMLSMGRHIVGLKADGTVVAVGNRRVAGWKDIVAVSAGTYHTVGVKADGTVVAAGYGKDKLCDIASWKDIVAVAAGDSCNPVGLKADGTVVAVGSNTFGQCDVADWTDIVAVSAGCWHTVGLKADGTVVTVGDNEDGLHDVVGWTDIVAVSAGTWHTVGLKADGTVVAVGSNFCGRCNVADWENIVAVAAGSVHTVGLKADGTVVAVGSNSCGQCDLSDWANIVAIAASCTRTAGLKADGTIVVTGSNDRHQCKVANWKLFNHIDTLPQELEEARIRAEEQRARRQAGVCQHCGGELKGLFGKKCVNCGKPKDY